MTAPFEVCWRRIERAQTHREAIAKIWHAFIDTDPYQPGVYVDDEGTGSIWVEQTAPIPDPIDLEIGEFLYQLRAALDASIYETVCMNSGLRPPPNPDKLEFPICFTDKSFLGSGTQDKIAPLTDEQRHIVQSVQPCYTPTDLTPDVLPYNFNRALQIMNDWARRDRHRTIHIVASWASNISPLLVVPKGTRVTNFSVGRDGFIFSHEHHAEIAMFRIDGWKRGMEIHANPNLFFDLAVDEVPPPCHDIDTLSFRFKAMTIAVTSIIEGLAKTVGVKHRS